MPRRRLTIPPYVARWQSIIHRPLPARVFNKIEPDGEAECVCISVSSRDHTYVTRDFIVTHNSLGAMAELTRIFAGKDPYRKRKDGNLRMYTVGKDEKHLADPLLLKVFWPGAFFCIDDEVTGLLRAVRFDPDNPTQIWTPDMERRQEWKPSPAFLTDNDIIIRWQKRGMGVPSILEHKHNGSRWQWFTSKSDPRAGTEIDIFHCDEEVERRGGRSWITEGQMRTADRMGIQLYSFTPQAATPEYFEMHKRAQRGEPGVEEFSITIDDNPFIPAESKRAMYEDLKHDPDELAVRYYGQYAIVQRRVFPQYDPEKHRIEDHEIPEEWMRILCLDPGAQFQGILFLAVPPTEDCVHAYGEIYQRNKTAMQLAEAAIPWVKPYQFESFVIDKKGGQQTPMGHAGGQGVRICDHYSNAFKAVGLESRRTGSAFEFGSDDVDGREGSIKRWLLHKPPLLKIHKAACPVLDSHLQNRQFSKVDPRKRDKRQAHDMTDLLGYGAAWFDEWLNDPSHTFGLFYMPPDELTLSNDARLLSAKLKAYELVGDTESAAKVKQDLDDLLAEEERNEKIFSAFTDWRKKLPPSLRFATQARPSPVPQLGV